MGKSIIPYILENPSLKNLFLEATSNTNISKVYSFQFKESDESNVNKFKMLLVDNYALRKILNKNVKLNKVFLINDLINDDSLKSNEDIIKINIPFTMNDIFQRIENHLNQERIDSKRLLKFKSFIYDPSTRKLYNDSQSLRFTEKESQIFICLVKDSKAYISKKELLYNVWSYGEGIDTHTLETHVYALRKKIETKLNLKNFIIFEEKKGYYCNKSIL